MNPFLAPTPLQVIRHDSVEQLLLLGRMLQGSTKLPWNFSRHPAATGTFFTLMLLGLKFCACQSQGHLQRFKPGLQLLEDRIYRYADPLSYTVFCIYVYRHSPFVFQLASCVLCLLTRFYLHLSILLSRLYACLAPITFESKNIERTCREEETLRYIGCCRGSLFFVDK